MRIILLCALILLIIIVVNCKSTDPYKVLGVSRTATAKEIKSAYKRMAREWHPDKNKRDNKEEAVRKFIQIREAYEILRDPAKRNKYDYFGYRDKSSSHDSENYGDFFSNFNWDEFDLDESISQSWKMAAEWMRETGIPTVHTQFDKVKRTIKDPKSKEKAKKWMNEKVASASSFWSNSILPGMDDLYNKVTDVKRDLNRMMEDMKRRSEERRKQ